MSTAAQEIHRFNAALHRAGALRIVVADEMALVREGLASICQCHRPHDEVIRCSDGVKALRTIQESRPDAAFVDWNLQDLPALEILRQVHASAVPTKIAIMMARADRKTVLEALRAGANAILLKSGPPSQFGESIQRMMTGEIYVSPLLNLDSSLLANDTETDPFDTLSPREFQVFNMLVEGVRAKEIAARLGLSPKTVDTYRSSLMHKLDIFDIAGLVKFYIKRSSANGR